MRKHELFWNYFVYIWFSNIYFKSYSCPWILTFRLGQKSLDEGSLCDIKITQKNHPFIINRTAVLERYFKSEPQFSVNHNFRWIIIFDDSVKIYKSNTAGETLAYIAEKGLPPDKVDRSPNSSFWASSQNTEQFVLSEQFEHHFFKSRSGRTPTVWSLVVREAYFWSNW